MPPPMNDSPRDFFRSLPGFAPTLLIDLPMLAQRAGVARVCVKDESRRLLGSFKSLGGIYAGLRALVRVSGAPNIAALLQQRSSQRSLPRLICASDGNHGLAVAVGAELAGTSARIYLHQHVPRQRAERIANRGAEIVWVEGTYDNAVDQATQAVERGEGLHIGDTSADPHDPVVADVMAGYEVAASEIAEQVRANNWPAPTHFFIQAGVGGLAAAMTRGLASAGLAQCQTIVVEPANVACVAAALSTGRIERLPGDLLTVAEMLSCGEASSPAMEILRTHRVKSIIVDEATLEGTPDILARSGGPATTPSGATGLAGLLTAVASPATAKQFGIDASSRVLLIVTEGTSNSPRGLTA